MTRVVAAATAISLIGVAIVLYLFPAETDRLFSWTIQPPLTALVLGAGYAGGAYLFTLMTIQPVWHRFELAMYGVWPFTTLVFLATLIHLDRFHHGHPVFNIWFFGYAVLPFALPLVWWLNNQRRIDAPIEARHLVPLVVRRLLIVVAIASLTLGAVMFVLPDLVIPIWPWTLTPLTARVLAAVYVLAGGLGLGLLRRPDWRQWRLPIHSQFIGYTLILLALPRGWSDLHLDNPLSWVFVATIVGGTVALGALIAYMETRPRLSRSR